MATRPGECGYCNLDHRSDEQCPEINRKDYEAWLASDEYKHRCTRAALDGAASRLNRALRYKYPDPMNPWFAVGVRFVPGVAAVIVVYCADLANPPTDYKHYEGFPVEIHQSGIPQLATG